MHDTENGGNVLGHRHPLSIIIRKATDIFDSMGFEVASGPVVETEFYNFDALNIPKDHPARDAWDTFFVQQHGEMSEKKLLRTHTSPVQIRYMESHEPPIRIIAPGRTYRYEAIDATHEAQFFQLEGLMIDREVSFGNMKYVFEKFFSAIFDKTVSVRMRPSYFPFVEPGFEVDISCFNCSQKGCGVCKRTGWIEILGAGMVQPSVLNNCKISPKTWRGFAFGCGIERIAMLKYGVNDIRLFHYGDIRVVNQF